MEPGALLEGRFRLDRIAGSGGMGEVWRAVDVASGGAVAVKILRGSRATDADRFAREATVLAKLTHPAIVGYVAHGTTPKQQRYLVMQWLEGESLADRLDRGPLSAAQTVLAARRLADAVRYVHQHGVVHRDLKPSNIQLVGGDVAQATLVDFGVAGLAGATQHLTRSNVSLGTIGYMAPEQIRGAHDAGPPADYFALGCVLFECLTGRAAFESPNPMGVLARILFEDPPGPRTIASETPDALDALVLALLAKNPVDRPGAQSFSEALTRAALGAGAAVSAAPRARSETLTDSEQRVVSVIVAARPLEDTDSGATLRDGDASVRLDSVRAAAQRFGARVEVLADGTVVCMLSGPESPIEQAARAARCALAVRRELPEAPVALATGRGIVAGAMPVGEAIDRAAHLVADGDAGAVVVEPATAALLEGRFLIEHVGDVLVLRDELATAETERTVRGRTTPFVGREREMGVLDGALEACVGEPSSQAVVVIGAAGTGKSRLRRELEARVRAARPDLVIARGRGDPWATSSPFSALASAILSVAGIRDAEGPLHQRQKLERLVGRHVAAAEVALVVDFVSVLVGVTAEPADPARVAAARTDPRVMQEQIRKALLTWLRAECASAPVLLVLEDLHWADLASVALVDAALGDLADAPFMVLALARPEAHERFPGLWRAHRTTEVRLSGLSKRAAEKLARDVLGPDATPEAIERVVTRADGNPFHLEELVRATLEGAAGELPDTILGMLQARLDALDGETRRLLRAASVFGERFWRGGIAALVGLGETSRALDDGLVELVAHELVAAKGRSTLDGEDELAFRHGLVREAAYSTLTAGDRQLGHRLAGLWLERVGSGDAAALAEHFQRGGDAPRAVPWCRREAERALDANDAVAALEWVERGLACGAAGEARGALLLVRGETLGWALHLSESITAAREALPLIAEGSALWYRGVWILVTIASRLAAGAEALGWIERVRATRPRGADAVVPRLRAIAWALTNLGTSTPPALADALCDEARRDAGDQVDPAIVGPLALALGARARLELGLDEAARQLERSVDAYERAGDERAAAYVQIVLGNAYAMAGDAAPALERFARASAVASATGSFALVAHARFSAGSVRSRAGDLAGATTDLELALADFESLGDPVFAVAARTRLAECVGAAGDSTRALALADEAIAGAQGLDAFLADALAVRSTIRLAGGDLPGALADARLAMDHRARTSQWTSDMLPGIARALAEALVATGDRAGALRVASEQRARLELAAARMQPTWGQSFLARVADHARIVSLCKELAP